MHDGGEVAGQIGGAGNFGEIVFFFGALEATAEGGDEGFAVADKLFAHAVGVIAAGEGALDGEAAAGVVGVGEVFYCALQ